MKFSFCFAKIYFRRIKAWLVSIIKNIHKWVKVYLIKLKAFKLKRLLMNLKISIWRVKKNYKESNYNTSTSLNEDGDLIKII